MARYKHKKGENGRKDKKFDGPILLRPSSFETVLAISEYLADEMGYNSKDVKQDVDFMLTLMYVLSKLCQKQEVLNGI